MHESLDLWLFGLGLQCASPLLGDGRASKEPDQADSQGAAYAW